ncbi:DMT family transporter [Aquihabitans sp. G128]|uniref:EamA family transporter n=1 Tax=Aquihabitans sp. G128 TaxID=2849779 RepID=UPI001C220FF2|nr:EamA family transporter [Aquihabitans sp. G128]QXC62792.1 DMT family transporter [Aquihabitans sp. G128]
MLLGPALLVEGAPPALTGTSVAGFAYLSLAATALAYVLWFQGIRRLPAAAPPLLGLAAPVTGAAIGWAVLGQDLSPLQLLGFALALGSIAYGATLGTPPDAGRTADRGAVPVRAPEAVGAP